MTKDQIIERFKSVTFWNDPETELLYQEEREQCALIALDIVIEAFKEFQEEEHSDNFWTLENKILDYQSLKKELEG